MLELGKYYQQRNGEVVGPLEVHKSASIGFEDYAFKAVGGHLSSFATRIWKANGSFHIDGSESDFDLISEVQFKPLNEQPKEEIVVNEFKLEVGKYYEDRVGVVHGPIDFCGDDIYPFIDYSTSRTWTEDGVCYRYEDSDKDLIKEVPNLNQEPEETKVKFKEITLKEALDVLKSDGTLYITDSEIERQQVTRQYGLAWLLDATKFEIEVKPVVKYLVVYGDFYDYQNISSTHYSSIEDFYSDYDQSQYPLAELIQFTRKEF